MADIRVQLPLSGELIPGIKLKKMLNITAEMEDGEWIVLDQTFGQDVIGETQEETLAAYRKQLAEHYLKVKQELNKLEEYIEEIN